MTRQRKVVLLVCDGLGRDWLSAEHTPNLMVLREESAALEQYAAVFPSVTRVSAASIATGCLPGNHGLHGNQMALSSGAGLSVHNAGLPGFRDLMRAATGKTLNVPTMAEYLAERGGQSVYSNVSPGAAYFLDPEHYGTVFHRSGSFGPGGVPILDERHLAVTHDLAGDEKSVERFCADFVQNKTGVLSIVWLANPDLTLHYHPLGSEAHVIALKHTDRLAGRIVDLIRAAREQEDVLLIVCSDHGHEVISGSVHLGRWLALRGLESELAQGHIVVAGQGTSALIYATAVGRPKLAEIFDELKSEPWCGRLFQGEELTQLGFARVAEVVAAVDMARTSQVNEYGVSGARWMVEDGESSIEMGCGQHGGLGPQETRPFCLLNHAKIPSIFVDARTELIDLAPTILTFLEVPFEPMDGRSLLQNL